jgi:general secretion pathway protein J
MIQSRGFTLLEILIALFIFAMLSIVMIGALHAVMDAEAGVENSAARLRQLQFTLLIMSRDIEQAVNRPVINAFGKEDAALIGTYNGFTLTHMGVANAVENLATSSMQRTRYVFAGGNLLRMVWPVLDLAPETQARTSFLLKEVNDGHFEYLGNNNRFYNTWPIKEQSDQILPLAIRIFLSIPSWGKMSELYVIPTQSNKK